MEVSKHGKKKSYDLQDGCIFAPDIGYFILPYTVVLDDSKFFDEYGRGIHDAPQVDSIKV